MKKHILLLTLLWFGFFSKAQNCENVITDDSLFLKTSARFNFDKAVDNFIYCTEAENIKDISEIASINNSCLKFAICYGCCEEKEIKLVTNGILQQDKKGNKFYQFKIYFYNSDLCKKLCHADLSFDLFPLKLPTSKIFIRLENFDQMLEIK